MKKLMKRIGAVLMAVAMMAALGVTGAFADENSTHVITIENTDQNVSHSYEAYQIFVGKLDASGQKLSDIQWGSGVNQTTLLAALKASNDSNLKKEGVNVFTDCSTAADVAEVFATFQSTDGLTDNSGAIDAIAKIIADSNALTSTKATFTEGTSGTYTASVTGDGYYFVKDTTASTALTNTGDKKSDTLSKYMLSVIKDTTIVAKDTHLNPDKKILQNGTTTVKEGTAAVGDTVTFQVTIPVPDTRKYVDHFVFDMKDKLPDGMTFMGISSVKVGEDTVPYTLTVAPKGSTTYAAYTAPADAATAVTTAGGQQIKLVFNGFKAFAEAKNGRIGADMVITYTAVVNDDADFTTTGNKNEVYFDYSNDPNHDYDGDEPTGDEPMGKTPEDQTTTYLANIVIQKTGDNNTTPALAGAQFEITSEDYNVTLVTGEKYVLETEELATGETRVDNKPYYLLMDGSYTDTAPTASTATSYKSNNVYQRVKFEKQNTTPGDSKKVEVTTDSAGQIKLQGLKPGTYKIQEKVAPSGYNLDATVYTVVLEWDGTAKAIKKGNGTSEDVVYDTEGTTATATLTIDNKSGAKLPSTGGIGTYVFTVAGVAIMAIAAGLLIVRHKKKAE